MTNGWMRNPTTRWAAALVLAFLFHGIGAQVPLPDPDLDLVGNGTVLATLPLDDGSLIIGGNFESISGTSRHHLARLLPDRTLDTNWNPSPDGPVAALAQGPGNTVYAGGYFHAVGGVPQRGLARIDRTSGSVDTSWTAAVSQGVTAIAVNPDGSLIVIPFVRDTRTVVRLSGVDGTELEWSAVFAPADYLVPDGHGSLYVAKRSFEFDSPTSTYRARIYKLVAATGEIDAQWLIDIAGTISDSLDALAVDGDALFAGGTFGLRKLAAASGEDFAGWNAPTARIAAIAIDGPDHLVVGGDFASIHGAPRYHLARLSTATGLPTPGWTASTNDVVDLIRRNVDGSMDVAGRFQSANEQQRIGLARLLADGTLASPREDVELPSKAFALATQEDGGVIVGGPFHRVGTSPHRNILRLDAQGSLDDAWHGELPSMPWVLATGRAGVVYAAMNHWSGLQRAPAEIARIDGTGQLDESWRPSADGWINALAVAESGDLFAGGDFSIIEGAHRRALARLDAKSGIPLPSWDAHIQCCSIHALAIEENHLYAGGELEAIGGVAREAVVRLSQTTSALDLTWKPPVIGDVPPILSSSAIWSPIPIEEEIGREEAFQRRTDHRFPA